MLHLLSLKDDDDAHKYLIEYRNEARSLVLDMSKKSEVICVPDK